MNGYPSTSGTETKIVQQPAVQRAFDQLEAALKDLSERWSQHNERIATCLAPSPSCPEKDNVKGPVGSCAVAERIHASTCQISQLSNQIRETTTQVEL